MTFFGFWQNFGSHKKIMEISSFYFGPGSPKNRFLRFFRKKFTKKWAGNTESRARPGNLQREERSDEREVAPAACGIPELLVLLVSCRSCRVVSVVICSFANHHDFPVFFSVF